MGAPKEILKRIKKSKGSLLFLVLWLILCLNDQSENKELHLGAMNKNIFGFWKMTAIRYQNESGEWESETVFGGASIFTEDGHINTFTRTSELAFGYSGTFAIKGNDLIIQPEVSSLPEIEGKTIVRSLKSLKDDQMTLTMLDDATGRTYEMDFLLKTRHFSI